MHGRWRAPWCAEPGDIDPSILEPRANSITETGILPLCSEWRTIDTWGLNDSWIAHNGRITEEYLDRYRPHGIMFHGPAILVPSVNRDDFRPEWMSMVRTLKRYAEDRGYVLAVRFRLRNGRVHWYGDLQVQWFSGPKA